MKYTAETVECFPIDSDKINKELDELHQRKNPNPDIHYYIHPKYSALIRKPVLAIIDWEFVGSDIDKSVTYSVFSATNNPDGSRTFNYGGSEELMITLPDLEKYLLPPITLAEFTKERRGYNSRIRRNEGEWMNYLSKMEVK